ncbi:MAG: T9SS type A sorting domain-containing protein [Saprospiraceae bacterium]|nr:T9SS type A sorting domain-containing protein [Saprospiraceae bacterium]
MKISTNPFSRLWLMLLLSALPGLTHALDYYWVNGSGLWSNFANHWAKIPNPTLPSHYHANVPTADDDVYFTANAQPGYIGYTPGDPYTLTVDAGSTVPKCRNMDWTGVPVGTVWGGSGSRIDIYGSMTLDANMSITYSGYIQMNSLSGNMKSIVSNGVHFPVEVIFAGNAGGWNLQDDFYCDGRVNHEGGLIETNGQKVTIGDTWFGNYYVANGQLHLGSSEFIILDGNAFFKYSSAQFDAGSSHIKMYGDAVSLEGTNHFSSPTHYNDVSFFGRCSPQKGFIWGNVDGTLTFHQFGFIGNYNTSAVIPVLNNVVFLGDGLISNVNSYNSLTFSPGRTYTIQDVAVINGQAPSNTDQIILPGGTLNVMGNGTCNGFITIRSWQAGTAFEIVNNSGADQTVHCVILEDVHAAGTNALRANDYVDLGNCLNWVFLTPSTGFDLYWVGGPGDWDDPCHWTSNPSAVTGDCTCIPNGATNVFFTANSGFTPATNDVEQVRTPADGSYIAFMNMDWSGVTGNPTFLSVFNGSITSDQYIYGSVAYSPDMTLDFRGASRFRGKYVHTITSAGKAFRSNVFFEGTGEYQFLDNIIFDNFAYTPVFFVYHLRGTIRTLGNSIYLGPNKNWFGNKNTSNNFVDQGAVLWLGEPGGNSSTVTFSGNAAFRAGYQPGNFHPVESHIIAYQNNGSPYVTAENRPHDFWDVSFYNGFTSGAGYFYGGILNKLTYYENTYAIIENSTPNRLIHELEMKDDGEIRGNQTFDIMTLTGGNVYRFQDGAVQTITSGGALNTSSDCEKYVTLHTGFPDKTATLRKEGGGFIVVNNIVLENVIGDVSTGATYSATNGILQGNTTGWTASLPPARTLYWVGGGGNWNDAAHWSLSSGGSGGECPPTPLDNVFFNAGSGLGPGNNVVLTQNWAYCKDMDWTGAGAGTTLSGVGRSLHVFGSLTLSAAMTYSVSGTWFRAEQPATIASAGRKYGFVYFWSPNGEWTLLDAFETVPDVDIHHYYGIINSNNQTIGTGRIWWGVTQSPWIIQGYTPSPTAKLFLGSSKMRFYPTAIWATRGIFNYDLGNFDAGTSEIIFESGVWATLNTPSTHTLEFYDVTFKWFNSALETGIFKINNKVLFEKNGTISAGIEIHEVEFRDDGVIFGSRPYHSMKFAPGKRYTFQAGSVQTIVPHNGIEGQFIAQGLPGQFIELKSSDINSPATIHMDDYNGTSTCTKYLFLTGMTHTGTEDIYVPTPGGNVFNNAGWQFFPCNPCPATIPVLDPASITTGCPPGKAKLILAGLKPDEWANWYTDPDATTNLVYSGGLGGNLFEPDITGPTTYYARVFSDGGLCESTVVLSVDITITTPPAAFNVTGGGTVCAGSNGVPVGLDGSATGVSYQLQLDGSDVGSPIPGTGAALDFGLQTAAGTYTVVATTNGTACSATMTGQAAVTGDLNTAPAVDAGSNTVSCGGTEPLLLNESGGEAVSWLWSGPNGFQSTDQNPVIANPLQENAGFYTVEITGANGCTNRQTIEVVLIVTNIYYADMDGDGYGDPDNSTQACSLPQGYVTDNTDCNDNDPLQFPGQVWYKDADNDGYSDGMFLVQCERPEDYKAEEELIATSGDCNDNPVTGGMIHPGAAEVCDNGIDDNCNGQIDEGCCDIAIVETSANAPSCPGDNDGSITAMATSSAGAITYAISGPLNQSNATGAFTGLPAGMYSLTVSDAEACISTASVEVLAGVDNTPPMLTCNSSHTVTFNGEPFISLSAAQLATVDSDDCGESSISLSNDAISCLQVGQIVPVVVMATDAHNNVSTCITNVTVEGLPCNWSVGSTSQSCDGDWYYDSGVGIFHGTAINCYYAPPFTQDEVSFAGLSLCGNGSIAAQVTGISGSTLGWAGIIMRETGAADAKKAQLMTNLNFLARREFRYLTGGQAYPQQFPSNDRRWLRLVRQGNQFLGYTSLNGISWFETMAAHIPMNDCIEVGLVITNYHLVSTVNATFANVRITGMQNTLLTPGEDAGDISMSYVSPLEGISVFPNPTSGTLNIDISAYHGQEMELEIYDIQGRRLLRKVIDEVQIPVEQIDMTLFQRGMYFVKAKAQDGPAATVRVVLER